MNKLINNEKHYLTLNNYLRFLYGKKLAKISLNLGATCPNRDGTLSNKGCIYCSENLSGEYGGNKSDALDVQFDKVSKMINKKWPDSYYIAYFQSGTNTYFDIETFKNKINGLYHNGQLINNRIKVISIATRADCLDEEKLKFLSSLKKDLDIWIELGFQTMHEKTIQLINRGYSNECFSKTIALIKKYNLKTIVHIINGLPNETKSMMIETTKYLNNLNIDGIKIHMLYIVDNARLAAYYSLNPFHILTLNEYSDIVANQIRTLNDNIVIHRLTGDPSYEHIIEPKWTLKKFVVINEIDKYMRKNNFFQGDLCIK